MNRNDPSPRLLILAMTLLSVALIVGFRVKADGGEVGSLTVSIDDRSVAHSGFQGSWYDEGGTLRIKVLSGGILELDSEWFDGTEILGPARLEGEKISLDVRRQGREWTYILELYDPGLLGLYREGSKPFCGSCATYLDQQGPVERMMKIPFYYLIYFTDMAYRFLIEG